MTRSLTPLTEDALRPFGNIGIRTPLSDVYGTAPAWPDGDPPDMERAECSALTVPGILSSLLSGPCQRLFVAERLTLPSKWLHFAWGTVNFKGTATSRFCVNLDQSNCCIASP